MDFKQLILLAFQVSILCTVFGFGLQTTPGTLTYLIRRPRLLFRSLAAVFVIMPVVAVLLVRTFNFPRTVEIVLIALSVSPLPPLLPQRETKAGGLRPYAIALMALLSLLAIVLVPLALEIVERVFRRPLSMDPWPVAKLAVMSTLLPLGAGVIVRRLLPRLADSIQKPVTLIANILLPIAVIALLIGTGPKIWALAGVGSVTAMLLFLGAGFAVGHVLGGPDPEHSLVLALSTACRHPAIALSIAAANFPTEAFGPAILLYVLLGVIAGVPYIAWQRRQMGTAPLPT